MIKFITDQKSQPKLPTFRDVEADQLFIDIYGRLCQKTTISSYSVIAKANGEPFSDHFYEVLSEEGIRRILPTVTKIEF